MENGAMPEILVEEAVTAREKKQDVKALLLYNDDFNTFEHVTNCLISVCAHNPVQAEQCTYLVHYTGKCVVKNGSYKALKPLCEALLEKGLTARIED
jgi:ATP-dependent Clp protease adaptor protein ClpS